MFFDNLMKANETENVCLFCNIYKSATIKMWKNVFDLVAALYHNFVV